MKFRKFLLLFVCLGITAVSVYYINRPHLSDMVGQMILVGFRGTGTGLYDQDVKIVEREIKRGHVGGIIIFNKDVISNYGPRNVETLEQVAQLNARLQQAAEIPLFISIDQEGGTVNRLTAEYGFEVTPSPWSLRKGEANDTRRFAHDLGSRLFALGFNVDFAPSVDLAINKDNPIIAKRERAFSADSKVVTLHAAAFAAGLQDAGLVYSYKHFPGHGSSSSDTHLGVVEVTNTWSDTELEPYRALVNSDMMGMVMVAHVTNRNIDDVPASLSKKTITGILREQMQYDGVVITDDLQMGAIVAEYGQEEIIRMAIDAGVDILLMGNNMTYDPEIAKHTHAAVMKMVRDGTVSRERIRQSYERIMKLKKKRGLIF